MAWGNKDELEPSMPGMAGVPSTPRSSPSVSTGGGGAKLSFIGGEVTLTGNLSGQGDLHLDGAVEGDISCNTMILGQSGRVKGNVTAEKATLGGTVGGTVNAHTLIIEKSAKINGDLTYENITIETGAHVDGRLSKRTEKTTPAAAARPAPVPPPPEQPLKLVAEKE